MTELQQHTINTPYMVGPVHCYGGELGGELTLFDTGPPTPAAQRYLQENIDLRQLRHVFITHCHIDHYGQANWLEQNSDAVIYLPERDCQKIARHDMRVKTLRRILASRGFDDEYLDKLQQIFDGRALLPPFPRRFQVAERELPEQLALKILPCPGHSQSDLVYVGETWAVTGDTLLKGVFQSPLLDVDLQQNTRFKNYEAYCTTIVRLMELKDKEVLPSHRQPITDISKVLLFYISKLLRRVEQLHDHMDEENLQVLIDRLLKGRLQDTMQIYLKASEIIFMQDFLQQPDLLCQSLKKIGLFEELADKFHSALHSG
ncbi:MAG: MBL fold metallo-hydrolase [Desulforhopalus sp.]